MNVSTVRALVLLASLLAGRPGLAQEAALDPFTTQALPAETTEEDVLRPGEVAFGVYDPHAAFRDDRSVDIEHVFVYWQALDLESFRRSLAYAQERGRTMMVTVEPYTRAENWRDGGDRLFADILSGDFDPEIERICGELAAFRGDVMVRWGHEMEDPTGRYPWARADSDGYKAAFRHVVGACRRLAPGAAFVWSPKGEANLADYYPGGDVVDFVGLSLWGLQSYDEKFEGGARTFRDTFREKYERVAFFAKPVIITELGVSGDAAYCDHWFASLFRELAGQSAFGQLRAVVYFNDKEPWHWPLGLGSPDWRIATGWFSRAKEATQKR